MRGDSGGGGKRFCRCVNDYSIRNGIPMYLVPNAARRRAASSTSAAGSFFHRDSDERDSQNQLKVVTHYSERSYAFRRFCSVRAVSVSQ